MACLVLCIYWLSFFVASCIFAAVDVFNLKLPQLIKDILQFGKIKDKKRKWTVVQWFEIPKSWFVHFYIAGSLVNGYFSYICISSYIFWQNPPDLLNSVLQLIITIPDHATTDAGSAMLLLIFMLIQTCRRLGECLFVSIYSKSTINVIHYVMGLSLYTLFPITVLCESPGLHIGRIENVKNELQQIRHIVGGVMFVFASWQQNVIHKQFAALRKDQHGCIKTLQHKVPKGGWFEFVSCPHYFMEIIIYLSFIVMAGARHVTLWTVFLFVASNQMLAAVMTHSWYKNTYKYYPNKRRAIIPYLL